MLNKELITPDFDSYPTERFVANATPVARGIDVTWDDGITTRFHVLWLRENAPDAETTHPVTREQALQLVDIDADIEITIARVSDTGGLVVEWSTGGMNRYDAGWLRAWATETDEAPFALPARRLWDRATLLEIPRFDGAAVLDGGEAFEAWCRALHVEGCAILSGLPTDTRTVEQVASLIGPVRDSNFGRVFDVRTSTKQTSNAYTSMALPVHADLCTREHMPGLQFLHCLENSTTGGASILADGFNIAKKLQAFHPDEFAALSQIPVTFYNKAEDEDYRWDSPVIELDPLGNVNKVRFSPWLRAPMSGSFEEIDRVYRGLRRIFSMAEEKENQVETTLKPGELLSFDNSRMLHGRTGFDASVGARWLRGCYGEREELQSKLRIQMRRERQCAAG